MVTRHPEPFDFIARIAADGLSAFPRSLSLPLLGFALLGAFKSPCEPSNQLFKAQERVLPLQAEAFLTPLQGLDALLYFTKPVLRQDLMAFS